MVNILTPEILVDTLRRLGNNTTAKRLCNTVVYELDCPVSHAQLAIQRAVDNNLIKLNHDWTLSL